MAEVIFTDENFQAEVIESDIPVLVDIYADWCGPCKMMAPLVEQLADEYEGRIKIGKLNGEEQADTAAAYDVMSVPTFLFFKGGEVVDTATGGMTKEQLVKKLDALL